MTKDQKRIKELEAIIGKSSMLFVQYVKKTDKQLAVKTKALIKIEKILSKITYK